MRANTSSRYALVLVDVKNRTERRLRTIIQNSPVLMAPALDWSSDGEWLVTSEQPMDVPAPVHLVLISLKDGRSWVITDPPNGSTGDLEARFSADGNRIVFRRGGHGELFELHRSGSAAGPPTQLTFQNGGVRGLSLSRDGKTIYFGSQREYGEFGLWELREGERTPIRITPETVAGIAPALDPEGRSLAFAQPAVDLNLWLYDSRHRSEPRLLAPSVHAEYAPEFSPDGRWVAFVSDRTGAPDIWISDLNGGQPRRVTALRKGDLPMSPSWSPDASRITFFCRRSGLNYAFETTIATGEMRPVKAGPDYALAPAYSADGKSLYYVSNAGNRFRIWRQPLSDGAPAEPLVADDVHFFRVAKDRGSLYFLRSEKLIRIDLAAREEHTVFAFPEPLAAYDAWDVAGNTLFYVSLGVEHTPSQLVAVDLVDGGRKMLGPIRQLSRDWQTSIAASPDGHSALVAQVDRDDTRLMVLRLNR